MMMDEKWKLSKSFSTRNTCSTTTPSSTNSHFTRSFSTKSNASSSSSSNHNHTTSSSHSNSPLLRKSSSLKYGGGSGGGGSGRFLQKGSSISRKCSNLAKEQKARFYIMRRCVAMLVCWHKHGDP
ncbi:Small polypeptide DEVIL 18 [Linum grandiflorum]